VSEAGEKQDRAREEGEQVTTTTKDRELTSRGPNNIPTRNPSTDLTQ